MSSDMERSLGSEPVSGWQARPLSAEVAQKLLERALWTEAGRSVAGPGSVVLREVAGRHRDMTEVDEPLLRELVGAVVAAGLNIRPRHAGAVADVTAAVAQSIHGDAAALQRVQGWWDRLRSSVA